MEQITSEEMEILNSAIDILSKYAERGHVTRADIEYFEKLVVSIIDESSSTGSETMDYTPKPIVRVYPTTKYRVDDSLYIRNIPAEKECGIEELNLYGYFSETNSLEILGEIRANRLTKELCMKCTLYDKDGDVIETSQSSSYGSGLVTSMIKPNAFFDGFPFKFTFWDVSKRKIKRIAITPEDDY